MITFAELKNKSAQLYPGVLLTHLAKFHARRRIRTSLLVLMVVAFVLMLFGPDSYIFAARGAFFVFVAFWISVYLLEAYYLSYYFDESQIDFDIARLVFLADPDDVTETFLKSELGRYTLLRLGIGTKEIDKFLKSKRTLVRDEDINLDVSIDAEFIDIRHLGHALYRADDSFRNFLADRAINEDVFLGALIWVDRDEWELRNAERWWTRPRLSRVQSIGRNWSFGKTFLIEKFGHRIMSDRAYETLGENWRAYKKEVAQIETILAKRQGSNVMLISPTTEIGLNVIASLGKMIMGGEILPELENKRIFVINTNMMITQAADRSEFEANLIEVLSQASLAGNVILTLPHFSEFLESAYKIGVDAATIFSEALASPTIQILAISDQRGYHESVETHFDLMQHFDKVQIADLDRHAVLKILQDEAHRLENKNTVFFTYLAIDEIANSVERFFVGSTFSDKVVDILQEVVNKALAEKQKIISREIVQQLVAIKTGIPQGVVSAEEGEKLSSLEEILHNRIIGQNEAVSAISDAMRRSRSGITNPSRPIGSFLFLGPTGVGKTETTKALAESFFKSEKDIIRLDMSEFTGADALDKLIGSFTMKEPGVLVQKISNKQYGVVLLDEFEKTSPKVQDLFLQILDEGQFTDALGQRINARNLIIVATSNAASDLIYKYSRTGVEISQHKDEIIDHIIAEKIFKPELLNRFDGVILFHALAKEHLHKIAKLMLQKLDQRLHNKGIRIDITDDLLNYLVQVGSDTKFGARSMNRAIQDEVEGLIAEKIISGEIGNNSHVSFRVSPKGDLEATVGVNVRS